MNITLVIPAKNESESLPLVIESLKNFPVKKIVILEKNDLATVNSIQRLDCEIIYQSSKGYGNAIIDGINAVKTEYLCIFNADGSFNGMDLEKMYLLIIKHNDDFIFASRYMNEGGSKDDTILTFVGNKIFTFIGNLLFSLNLSDILYTYLLGKTKAFQKLNLTSNDFRLCVELPVKIKENNFQYRSVGSFEEKRLFGSKKVNEFKDGLFILLHLFFLYFKKLTK
jgi:glycosyltransferase involved in cell wall biosynthesis